MCMEVFLFPRRRDQSFLYFLHVHGGVSDLRQAFQVQRLFSPCAWRCFRERRVPYGGGKIFSMCMEVFLKHLLKNIHRLNFLHVHGGVSVFGCCSCDVS